MQEYIKLRKFIKEIEDDLDDNFYISYVITDYLKKGKYDVKKIKQLNKYISMFDKEEINECMNEVGLRYNYRPYSLIGTVDPKEDKQDIKLLETNSKKEENNYIISSQDTDSINYSFISTKECTNLVLQPSVFDKNDKKLNRNNNHKRVKKDKVKVLTLIRVILHTPTDEFNEIEKKYEKVLRK